MAQKFVDIGSTANDGTGTNQRDAWDFVNQNFTEVYGFQTNNIIVINQESDFPNQTATTITLDAGLCYHLGDTIITNKNFVVEGGLGVCFKSNTGLSLGLVYGGAGNLFTMGAGASLQLSDIGISAPLANLFDFDGASTLNMFNFISLGCVGIGTFVAGSTSSVVLDNWALLDVSGNGFDFTGNWALLSMSRVLSQTTSTSHEFIDMNTATFDDVNLSRVEVDGPSGSVFIKGATGSANINANRLAVVTVCTIAGGMTPLSGVENGDFRWDFQKNSPIRDSMTHADIFLTGGAETITTGSAGDWQEIGVPSGGGVSWDSDLAERFTVGTDGTLTYIGERPIDVRMTGRATIEKSGGGSDILEARIAKNWDGTASDGGLEKSRAQTESSSPTTVPIGALTHLEQNDDIRVIFSNTNGTANIIASVSSLEVSE